MWEVRNATPYVAERAVVVDKTGERHWVVIVKGTFTIGRDGVLAPAPEQVPANPGPEYRGEPGKSSLLYEQDLIAEKAGSDVYFNATAHVPGGRAATEVTVGIKTPLGTKALLVTGERRWERNAIGQIEPSLPQPFVKMPIVYEQAQGGYDEQDPDLTKHRLDPANPVGRGFFTSAAHRVGRPLPNIEHPNGDNSKGPAGLGALCSYWQARARHQGTYDAKWVETQKPLLPIDYDPLFLQCAPVDQQFYPPLRGGELIGLVNLTREGSLKFEVPKHHFAFRTQVGSRRFEHRGKIATVVVEPDHPRVIVVWHSQLSCHHDIDDIDYTKITEKRYV